VIKVELSAYYSSLHCHMILQKSFTQKKIYIFLDKIGQMGKGNIFLKIYFLDNIGQMDNIFLKNMYFWTI